MMDTKFLTIAVSLVLVSGFGCNPDDFVPPTGAGQELVAECPVGGLSTEDLTREGVQCQAVTSPTVSDCTDTRTLLEDEVTADMTLDGCYETSGFTVASGVTLTLAPGTDILFTPTDAAITVEGSIVASGTESDPIYLHGATTPGSWGGIRLMEVSTGNTFEHVIFENGGGFDWNTSNAENAMLVVQDDSTEVSVSNSTFRGSAGYGLHIAGPKAVTSLDAVEFEGNDSGAAQIPPNQMQAFASDLAFGEDQWVHITGGTVSDDQTWEACVPWRFRQGVTIGGDAVVEAAPGAEFAFQSEAYLEVNEGVLNAVGTADQAVLFTGIQKEAGSWGGINFNAETVSTQNVLENAIIEYAGGFDWDTSDVKNTAVSAQTATVSLAIRNSIIRDSSALGVFARSSENALAVQNVVFENNADGAAEVTPNHLDAFDETSSYAGQDVTIRSGSTSRDTTASDCVPYLVAGDLEVGAGSALTVEPGSDLRFAEEVGFEVVGTLDAMATEENVTYFRGADDAAGSWGGMRVSGDSLTMLDWVVIEHGGGIDWDTSSSQEANFNVLDAESELVIENTTMRQSAGGGIYFNEDPAFSCFNILVDDSPMVFGTFEDFDAACDEGTYGR